MVQKSISLYYFGTLPSWLREAHPWAVSYTRPGVLRVSDIPLRLRTGLRSAPRGRSTNGSPGTKICPLPPARPQGFHNVAGDIDFTNYDKEEWFDAHLTPLGWSQVRKAGGGGITRSYYRGAGLSAASGDARVLYSASRLPGIAPRRFYAQQAAAVHAHATCGTMISTNTTMHQLTRRYTHTHPSQAAALRRFLRKQEEALPIAVPELIVVSPLMRTLETAVGCDLKKAGAKKTRAN